ncbi:MAG TPA: cytochrome D1 domain-containing protein [Thermoanaerobaculia bacterium]|nr:cytochrome D1 domain-containing protein [Thermoanaerobaculia bacterium]
MLHAALTALLALQPASGSPNPAPQAPAPNSAAPAGVVNAPSSAPSEPSDASAAPAAPESPAPTAVPAARPTPARRSGAPEPARPSSGDSLLVVNKTDSTVSILDGSTGKLRTTVAVDPGPHEVEMLPGGHVAAVASYGTRAEPGRTVTLIDVATGKVLTKLDLGEGSRPHGMAAVRDGRLLVTAEGKKELVVIDTRGEKISARYPTGRDLSHMVAVSPDGHRAFVASLSGGGSVAVFDLANGKVLKDIPTGKGAEGIDVTPDGREVWVANREANTITVIDVKTLAPVFTIQAPGFPIRVKITPDGRRAIATFAGAGDVRVYDTATRVEAARIPLGREAVEGSENRVFQKRFGTSPAPVGLLISTDGKRAYVAASHADVVTVVDLEKLRVDDAWAAGREPDGLAGHISTKAPEATPRPTLTPRPEVTRRPGLPPRPTPRPHS